MTNPISTYVTEHLSVFLRDKELSEETVTAVTNEIEDRLVSILSHWNDAEFRFTLLLVAQEEAAFPLHLYTSVHWQQRLTALILSHP